MIDQLDSPTGQTGKGDEDAWRVIGHSRSPPEPRVEAGVQELTEMTIGRTDDPENPLEPVALEAAGLFGTGSRTPSGPAVIVPRQQAEHMIAVNRPSEFSSKFLNPRGRPHMHAKPD